MSKLKSAVKKVVGTLNEPQASEKVKSNKLTKDFTADVPKQRYSLRKRNSQEVKTPIKRTKIGKARSVKSVVEKVNEKSKVNKATMKKSDVTGVTLSETTVSYKDVPSTSTVESNNSSTSDDTATMNRL